MTGWLSAHQIKVKGVVAGSGFASKDILKQFDLLGIKYVAILKADSSASQKMLAKYASAIRGRYEYALDVFSDGKKPAEIGHRPEKLFLENDNVVYGIAAEKKIKLFSDHSYEAYVSLLFDGSKAEERRQNWFMKISNAALNLQSQIDAGKNDASAPPEFENYLEIRDIDGEKVAAVKQEQVQIRGDSLGFSALASSDRMGASEANRIHALRKSEEECFVTAQKLLRYRKNRVCADSGSGIVTRLAIAFIASIIRSELAKAAKACSQATDNIIRELNFITIHADSSDRYFACHAESESQKLFLRECGVVPSDLDRIAEAENARRNCKEPDLFHKFPHREETV